MDEGEVVCGICLGFIFFPWCLQGAYRSAPFSFLEFSIVFHVSGIFLVCWCLPLASFLGYSIVSGSI
ncbi:hypothetical protein L210DRAFT_3580449 [Boletus edulis BED1]|uniref:Uncharacterized protein n=1 Tax=Boletus edulis BED1 TaxID=1328754 RepID=A0AAD4BCF3_BOLED|nr:hypothetical protein L210DRAFT_3580449 [Boletus edulis BED1]